MPIGKLNEDDRQRLDDHFDVLQDNAIPVSFPLLSRMLGVDRSVIVTGQKRLREQENTDGQDST